MAAKKIFISFDYDNDRNYRYLLNALKANPHSDIDFIDLTPEEIQSSEVSRIKAALTTRIRQSTHTLVIVGAEANSYHPDRDEIGERNWQWWEIEKSCVEGNGLIAVKIASAYTAPDPLYQKNATWALTFRVESIVKAIEEA